MSRGLIYLSSLDKTPFEDEQKIRYDVNLQDDINGIALSSFDFVYGFCNINSKSKTAFLESGSQTFEVELSVGFYDYAQLLTEMKAKLDAIGIGAFTISFTDNIYALSAPVVAKFAVPPM